MTANDKTTSDNMASDLEKTLEMVKSSRSRHENMAQYHRDLVKWARNVDKRYAWVVLFALWLTMAASLGPYRIYGLIYAKITKAGHYTREEASWPVSMIFTVENIVGPLVSIVVYHISFRSSLFVGGVLLALGNSLAFWSDSLTLDVILIGCVQGIGFAFIFMPFMEIINNYFLKYRNLALGWALCGGTMSVFFWSPIFQWVLERYPWRTAYLGMGLVCCLTILMVPFLKPNPRPNPPACMYHNKSLNKLNTAASQSGAFEKGSTLSRVSFRALSFQNSQRRQSTILISRQKSLSRQSSIISVNPFASSVGLERKISRTIKEDFHHPKQVLEHQKEMEVKTKSLSEIADPSDENEFELSTILEILKTPGFHLIWYLELIYFWVFSIYCLVLVDFGIDRGCTSEQAERLLSFQSVGEIIGRMGLTILVDMHFLSNRNVVTLTLVIISILLVTVTQVTGYAIIATLTVLINAFASLLYILLNGLLVDFLGERQVTIGYGMSSFVVGILIISRPQAVGFFRDTLGSYDWLMICLSASCALGAVLTILERLVTRVCSLKTKDDQQSESMA